MSVRIVYLAALAIFLAGCKVVITAPEGSSVTSESGTYSCPGNGCVIETNDLFFNETFVANPPEGQVFSHWKKVEDGFCGEKTVPCELKTEHMDKHPALAEILADPDREFYLEPVFVAGGEAICEYEQSAGPFKYDVCHTGQDEDSCAGNYAGTFSQGSCSEGRDPGPAGICMTDDGDIYYYDHSSSEANYSMGCGFLQGEWRDLR